MMPKKSVGPTNILLADKEVGGGGRQKISVWDLLSGKLSRDCIFLCQQPNNNFLIYYCYREAYPEAPVEDIQFAYNITRLVKLDKRR